MKALQELIIKTVDERYPYDTDFYNIVGFNVGRWNEFKKETQTSETWRMIELKK